MQRQNGFTIDGITVFTETSQPYWKYYILNRRLQCIHVKKIDFLFDLTQHRKKGLQSNIRKMGSNSSLVNITNLKDFQYLFRDF